jgi:hypothetical protein
MKSVDKLCIEQSSLGNGHTDDGMTKSGTLFSGDRHNSAAATGTTARSTVIKLSDNELNVCQQLLGLEGMLKGGDADCEISKLSDDQLAFCEQQMNCSLKTYLVVGVTSDDDLHVCLSDMFLHGLNNLGPLTDSNKPYFDDCPVCLSKLPQTNCLQYQPCCGKVLCVACIKSIYITHIEDDKERARTGKARKNTPPLCPFCRIPVSTSAEESVQRLKKRIGINPSDPHAKCLLALCYIDDDSDGLLQRDTTKAIDLFVSAAEEGSAVACGALGELYNPTLPRKSIEPDLLKSLHYYRLAAKAGNTEALVHLALLALEFGSDERLVFKHFVSAALQGCDRALDIVKVGYIKEVVSKDDYERALRGWFKTNSESIVDDCWRARAAFSSRPDGSQSIFATFSPPEE